MYVVRFHHYRIEISKRHKRKMLLNNEFSKPLNNCTNILYIKYTRACGGCAKSEFI